MFCPTYEANYKCGNRDPQDFHRHALTESEKAYYEKRAPEYDDWYLGTGLYADRVRPGWERELDNLRAELRSLPLHGTLDVACGTGFLTQHLQGPVVALDHSLSMLKVARESARVRWVAQSDALRLPFGTAAFDCLFAGHFYGHLREDDRRRFLGEARRGASHAGS